MSTSPKIAQDILPSMHGRYKKTLVHEDEGITSAVPPRFAWECVPSALISPTNIRDSLYRAYPRRSTILINEGFFGDLIRRHSAAATGSGFQPVTAHSLSAPGSLLLLKLNIRLLGGL
jgi:hypothetical protein